MTNSKQSRGNTANGGQSSTKAGAMSSESQESLTQRVSQDYLDPAMGRMKEMVDQRPMSAVMTCLGLGFGIGLLVAAALATPPQRRRRLSTTEQLGQQVLDAVTRVLPASLSQSLRSDR